MDASAYSLNAPVATGLEETEKRGRGVEVELRRLSSHADYEKAVELQRVTWGEAFRDIVPAAILKVTQRIGGVTAGAFGPDGDLFGFVYGITGFYDNRCVHWSHMLGVRPDLRDQGLGQRLKEYQRQLLVELGIDWMYWTFDPMVARNAHLNLNRLQVSVREYVPDMYGDTGSSLHAFGTDRFVVAWSVRSPAPSGGERPARALREAWIQEAPVLNDESEEGIDAVMRSKLPVILIEIPRDIEELSVSQARMWRASTRRSFLASLANGYEVTSLHRDGDREFYLLIHPNV